MLSSGDNKSRAESAAKLLDSQPPVFPEDTTHPEETTPSEEATPTVQSCRIVADTQSPQSSTSEVGAALPPSTPLKETDSDLMVKKERQTMLLLMLHYLVYVS